MAEGWSVWVVCLGGVQRGVGRVEGSGERGVCIIVVRAVHSVFANAGRKGKTIRGILALAGALKSHSREGGRRETRPSHGAVDRVVV